jgi:hypothetical protein
MKLKTLAGEFYFNTQYISHINLNSDHTLLTIHFVNGTASGFSADTDIESTAIADFLEQLTDEKSGFVAVGSEMLNLKSALWVALTNDGPIQVRSSDNRTRTFEHEDPARFRKLLEEGGKDEG